MIKKAGQVLALALLLTGCQQDDAGEITAGTFDPGLAEQQRSICEDKGGRWGSGGETGRQVCYVTPRDANQACTSSADCESLCLARSQTCAPVAPFFGCHEVLNARGAVQTLCIE